MDFIEKTISIENPLSLENYFHGKIIFIENLLHIQNFAFEVILALDLN
jgi:hypothetical protein